MEKHHIAELQVEATKAVAFIWEKFKALYPELRKHTCPTVSINNRLKTTGGRAGGFLGNQIELSAELYFYNQEEFYREIIPHEIAHLVDYMLTGNMGHGPTWKSIMQAYGLPGDRLHNLINPLQVKRDIARGNVSESIKESAPKNPTFYKIGARVQFEHRNRQRVTTIHRGKITKINLKTIKMVSEVDGLEWTVPMSNASLQNI